MLFLLGSILLSGFLTIAFKICDRYSINKFQAIVCNYGFCVLTGSVFTRSVPALGEAVHQPWFNWSLLMGFLFIASFNLIAFSVQKNGLAVAAVASKTSLVIPFLFSVIIYREHASFVTIAGILLALIAVVCTVWPGSAAAGVSKPINANRGINLVLPLSVFLATGLLDAFIKFIEQDFITAANHNHYLINTFLVAFALGLLLLLFKIFTGNLSFQPKALLAGLVIGIPNYFSIYCLMTVLKAYPNFSAVVIPVNNMGIVLLSALVAWFFFHEKLSVLNWVGIVLAIVAVLMIAIGNQIIIYGIL
jgi:drug/metabolite transporter (DMT)-like permease